MNDTNNPLVASFLQLLAVEVAKLLPATATTDATDSTAALAEEHGFLIKMADLTARMDKLEESVENYDPTEAYNFDREVDRITGNAIDSHDFSEAIAAAVEEAVKEAIGNLNFTVSVS